MKKMQTQLQKLNKELYEAFCNSLEKAQTEWLPNVVPKKSSYNSFPHIMGVMEQADNLLYNYEQGCADIVLNDIELYIMLNSILLHDIGKGVIGEEYKNGHADRSRMVIEKYWAQLGIKNERIAEIISRIVLFHAPDYKLATKKEDNKAAEIVVIESQKTILDRLSYKTEVYSYGFVRSKLLAVLLFVADHLDNSYTRVPPSYIEKQLQVVGDFRKNIISTYYSKQSQMVYVEVRDGIISATSKTEDMEDNNELVLIAEQLESIFDSELENARRIYEQLEAKWTNEDNKSEDLKKKIDNKNELYKKLESATKDEEDKKCENGFVYERDALWDICITEFLKAKHEFENLKSNSSSVAEGSNKIEKEKKELIASLLNKAEIKEYTLEKISEGINRKIGALTRINGKEFKKNRKSTTQNPQLNKLAELIVKSVILNSESMKDMQRDLELIGIPIKKWCIEQKGILMEPLYSNGEYSCIFAYEPILDIKYLEDVIDALITIDSGIIGKEYHSYESVANFMHEDIKNIEKVKSAISRISLLMEEWNSGSQECPCHFIYDFHINCDTKGWNIESDKNEKRKPKKGKPKINWDGKKGFAYLIKKRIYEKLGGKDDE
ncbi:MAG: HD domain-containing protein [Clostridia bacterium]|nr:HD domain-containing protein [Clostridia bacterium]